MKTDVTIDRPTRLANRLATHANQLTRLAAAGLMLLTGLVAALPARAAENVWSTDYFNSRKSDWEQFVGAVVRIEGRVSLAGGGQFRLVKCDLPIHASDTMIRSLQAKKSVEITGRFKRDNGKLVFEADRIQNLPTDLEQYNSRTAKLRNDDAADWYEVGDWASERSRFYDDADLAKKARTAYEHGLMAESRNLKADDAGGRFQLATKVAGYKLPEALRMELMHEGDRILWHAALKARPFDRDSWAKLIKKLAEDLPGSTQPLKAIPEELAGRYEREPLAVYHDSPDDVRKQLHRILYTNVLIKVIGEDAAPDGRNGDAIAARLEAEAPEFPQLAKQYRDQKMTWRIGQAATATRPEIEQLAADLRTRQQPDQARLVLTKWLRAREPRLRQDGAVGYLQLADEYLLLLQDERNAVAVLAEAHKLDPAFADVTEKLQSLGYADVGGTWVKSLQPKVPNPVEMPDAVIPGTFAIGMNAATARNVMGSGVTGRVLTKRGVSEVWSFGAPGTSRVIIRLEGTNLSPELRVTDIRSER
jgi:hypothetical protein